MTLCACEVFFGMAELLVVSVSFIIFTVLDLVDRILCVVFWALDSLLDPGSPPCYCKQRLNGVLPEGGPTFKPAHSVLLQEGASCGEPANGTSLHATYVSKSGDRPPPTTYFNGSKSSPLLVTCCDVFPSPAMAIDNADEEHVGCGAHTKETFFAAELVHCRDGSGDLFSHDEHAPGSYGYEHIPSDVKNAVLDNTNKSCALAIQHAHTAEKNYLSRLLGQHPPHPFLPFEMREGFSPSSSTDIAGRNNPIASLQTNDNFSRGLLSRWSDCGCSTCTSWHTNEKESLYVHEEGKGHENVIFIHGFLSSSLLWSEKVIPHLSDTESGTYRLFAVDLLGFGKSPKPRTCLYTMADQIKKIEECVLHRYKIDSFHLVAHSMGCLVALALAAAHVDSIKTVTLVAPPYFPAPANEVGASYVLRQVAPRRIWPLTAFGASVMSWYEHVGRGVCFVLCKQHITWEYVIGFLTSNRISRASVRDFMQHTHHSAWHIFHNVICGEAHAMDGYLDKLERVGCIIHVVHGKDDKVVPTRCSYQLRKRYPTLKLQLQDGANHFTIIYGREELFARMLGRIWRIEEKSRKEM